jgi:hypothetical protein
LYDFPYWGNATNGLNGSSPLFYQSSTGYIGLNNPNPARQLDVAGSSNVTSLTGLDPSAIGITNTNSSTNNDYSALSFLTYDVNNNPILVAKLSGIATSHASGTVSGQLSFITKNAGTNQDDLDISPSGNITQDFGTANFGSTTINGNATTSNLAITALGSSGTPCLTVNAAGNVATTTCGGGSSQWTTSSGTLYYNGGNVGIGTTSSSALLYVNGSTTISNNLTVGQTLIPADINIPSSDMFIGNGAGNATATGTQDIVIGVNAGTDLTAPALGATPQNDIVLGSTACPVMTTARETVCIGTNAGQNYVGNGAGIEDGLSTFIGSYAGEDYTGIPSTNTDMMFIGQKAGNNVTTGNLSMFLGNHSGWNVTNAQSSVIIGQAAMGNSSDTSQANVDVVVGSYADFSANGTVQQSVIIGEDAGYNTASTSQDTFVGESAGYNNTTGADNTALGFEAGNGNITSNGNTWVGWQDGLHGTGQYNAMFGADDAPNSSSSNGNVLLGYNTGNALTTGGYNVVAGYQAGGAITTGAGNVVIGQASNVSGATDGNEIVLGQNAVGHGSNTATIGSTSSTASFINGELVMTTSSVANASTTCFRVVDLSGTTDWIYYSSQTQVVTTTKPSFCAF